MRIAVLSDTHDRLPDSLCERIRDADAIWHLGDVCSPKIIATLKTLGPPKCDLFLHGHTHVPRDETIGGVRFLNPGCISRPKSAPPSFAWLTIEPAGLMWKVMPL